jgi:hypothetical protein
MFSCTDRSVDEGDCSRIECAEGRKKTAFEIVLDTHRPFEYQQRTLGSKYELTYFDMRIGELYGVGVFENLAKPLRRIR